MEIFTQFTNYIQLAAGYVTVAGAVLGVLAFSGRLISGGGKGSSRSSVRSGSGSRSARPSSGLLHHLAGRLSNLTPVFWSVLFIAAASGCLVLDAKQFHGDSWALRFMFGVLVLIWFCFDVYIVSWLTGDTFNDSSYGNNRGTIWKMAWILYILLATVSIFCFIDSTTRQFVTDLLFPVVFFGGYALQVLCFLTGDF